MPRPMLTRPARALFALVLAAIGGVPVTPAAAQVSSEVELTLASQSPAWTTPPDQPGAQPVVTIIVVATNNGVAPLRELRLVAQLGLPFISRRSYEEAITAGPASVMASRSVPLDGTLEPGDTEDFRIDLDMSTIEGVQQDDSKVYPLRVQVRSRGESVGELVTAAIHVVRKPEVPLRLAWWYEVAPPAAFGPDGRLADTSIEAAIAQGGTLAAPLAAIRAHAGAGEPVDLVVRPSFLEDLRAMADGYERSDGSQVAAGEGAAAAAGGTPRLDIAAGAHP